MAHPSPPAILLDIDSAMRAGDMPRAIALACQALDAGHVAPTLFGLRSYWHESQDRLDAAAVDLARASAMAPSDARTLASLGRVLSKLGRSPEALTLLDEALRLSPDQASAHYERGFALEQTGALVAAKASYERALALAPGMANAAARLASLAARRSDWDSAERLAQAALALDPDDAVAQFALVMKAMAQGDHAAAATRARHVAEAPATIPQARAHALSFLADALDAQDRTAEAFAAYTNANALLRTIFQDRFTGVETGLPLSQRLRTFLTDMPDMPAQEPAEPSPVFILGFARVGTTLLGQILASHPRFSTIEEKPLLLDAMNDFLVPPDGLQKLMALPPAECERYRALYRARARAESWKEDRILVDQTPLHTLHLLLIAKLFPGARILFALRDPRDVVLSCFRRLFIPNAYTVEFLSLDRTARFYDAAMDCAQLAREKLPLRFHDMRNETLVADFQGEMQRMCDFLDVPFDPAMANFADRSRSGAVATPSATQIAKGLSSAGIGQWKRYRQQMEPVMPLLAPWAQRLGYSA